MTSAPEYTLYYHMGFSGRGLPIELLLRDAGISYEKVHPAMRPDETSRVVLQNPSTPSFAPPAIKKGDLVLSQTTNIMQYLGTVHGYAPADPAGLAIVNQVTLDAADLFSEAFTARSSADHGEKFLAEGRFDMWISHFTKVFSKYAKPYVNSETPTFADFMVLSLFINLEWMFGKEKIQQHTTEVISRWRGAIDSRPNIVAFYNLEGAEPPLSAGMKAH